ncbi:MULTISPECIES: helix-turn-helix domain-containing protein [Enterococcus]|jgi:transcriptional regulator with XRE-family HTH domain|uniref:DNA-binding helix-turn-helix protein n=1 Tax=Enterococcus casseliflavus ATCC 12755 TaxID=888066 RepID=F0EKV6_ENTCA|nr:MULTISPECIES: helix-turn-helix transcriptional regulator [Enterococcus]EGC69397.1 DNA-binding helix-turn-helix protein [Enterococcus casseliflavus ATCC 12755]
MDLPIGEEIARRRKHRGVTQQELAAFMNVSKASVSKWETGQTYPDITSLPLLAAYFDCSVDELLILDSQLSPKEIQRIYQLLKDAFQTKTPTEVLALAQSFTKRYYSCYPFLLQMGSFYLNHWDLLPDVPVEGVPKGQTYEDALMEAKKNTYLKEAETLYQRIMDQGDSELAQQAKQIDAYCLLMRNKPEEVLAILGTKTLSFLPSEPLIAAAFQQKNQLQQAEIVTQSAIYQYLIIFMSLLTNYLAMLTQDEEQLEKNYARGLALSESFQLAELHPLSLLNFLAAGMVSFAALGKESLLLQALTLYVKTLEATPEEIVLKGDDYFNSIDEWISELELGSQIPRNSGSVKKQFLAIAQLTPLFEPYQEKPSFKELFQRLSNLAEQVSNSQRSDSHE